MPERIEKIDEMDLLKRKINSLERHLKKIEYQLAPLKGNQIRGHRGI